MSDLLIIIPAYNEEGSIENVVNNIIKNYPQYDYVIINDGSRDKTSQICHENHYNIVDLPVNLGLAGAFQTGFRYAYECNLMQMVNTYQNIFKVWKKKSMMALI